MRGNPDSCGVWAPDLSYADGRFHLVYTDVKRYGRTTVEGAVGSSFRDFHNYWVWSDRIEGEWSDPVHLNSSGFDPALFHDDDGRSWLLNMLWDHRPGRRRFAGVLLQEMDLRTGRLVGDRRLIFEGTPLGFTEGPHLYKRDGWYHLLVAEGGTERNHAVVMARSRSLFGSYEVHPDGPVLTSTGKVDAPLVRAGHGDLVDTPSGETWMVYLCGRPLKVSDRCVLGRESAIQQMQWGEDGWLRTPDGNGAPMLEIEGAGVANAARVPLDERHEFDTAALPQAFQWLRTPYPDDLFSLTDRPGYLRLYGRESLGSRFTQSLVARRQEAFRFAAETVVEVSPSNFQQAAGLICYYNATKFHFFQITANDNGERQLQVLSAIPAEECSVITEPVAIPSGPVGLRVEIDHEVARFAYLPQGTRDWNWLPQTFDASILSDEATLSGLPNFTGAFVGMACYDLSGAKMSADFAHFDYRELDSSGGTRG
jgi:xylan 1,4-beta-xylosidase